VAGGIGVGWGGLLLLCFAGYNVIDVIEDNRKPVHSFIITVTFDDWEFWDFAIDVINEEVTGDHFERLTFLEAELDRIKEFNTALPKEDV
jgi:hypothetical protein